MRRWLLRILICVLLGAVTTVAAAWAIRNVNLSHLGAEIAEVTIQTSLGETDVTAWREPGFHSIGLVSPRLGTPPYASTMGDEAHARLAAHAVELTTRAPSTVNNIWERRDGLPFHAMSSWNTFTRATKKSDQYDEWVIPIRAASPGVNPLNLRLPYRPIWPGFALNNLVYAGAWWVLLAYAASWRSHARPLSRTRCIVFGAIIVMMGCVSTIGVSWLCAMSSELQPFTQPVYGTRPIAKDAKRDPSFWLDGRRIGLWRIERAEVPGFVEIKSALEAFTEQSAFRLIPGPWDTDAGLVAISPIEVAKDFLRPPNDLIGKEIEDRDDVTETDRVVRASGWPMLAMWGGKAAIIRRGRTITRETSHFEGAVEVDPYGYSQGRRSPNLPLIPLRPLWPGFGVNLLFYAGLWGGFLILIAGPKPWVRELRRRRGRCLACGYDLRRDFATGCPECGWNRAAAR